MTTQQKTALWVTALMGGTFVLTFLAYLVRK